MDIVALMSLASSVEDEAPRLAADLGSTVYETALLLRGPSPVPVLRTPDRARALDLLGKMRARGHHVVACDATSVVSADGMVQVRSFQLEDEGLSVTSTTGASDRVAWSDVIAFVRAMHRTRTERVEKTTERKFSLGRAAMTGGVLLTAKETKSTTHASEEREQVLYVFRQGGVPLLLGQSRMRYEGLGVDLRPSQAENFTVLFGLLRTRAPNAASDERLLASRPGLDRIRAGVSGATTSSSDGVDLLAHLIALASAHAARPYR